MLSFTFLSCLLAYPKYLFYLLNSPYSVLLFFFSQRPQNIKNDFSWEGGGKSHCKQSYFVKLSRAKASL